MKTISPSTCHKADDALLLDVRTPIEFAELHPPRAVLMPLAELTPEKVQELAQGRPIHLLCRTGNRARRAAEKLANLGNVAVVEGGILAWEGAALPLNRGKSIISLERQVRIAAGAFVALGVLLGYLAHPAFFLVPGVVGAGLVFAGVTNTCGLGMALARMPWNRTAAVSSPTCAIGAAPKTASESIATK